MREEERREHSVYELGHTGEEVPESLRPHLLLGHVQKTNGVAIAVQVRPDGVQCLVKLSLNISELFEYFIG